MVADNLSINRGAATQPKYCGFDINGNFVQTANPSRPQWGDGTTTTYYNVHDAAMLALLMQVWWHNIRNWSPVQVTTSTPVSATGVLNMPTSGEVRSLICQIPTLPPGVSGIFGTPGWFKFGYGAFIYPGGNGPLHFINWQNSVLFPEQPGATGFAYLLQQGVNANMWFQYLPHDAPPTLQMSSLTTQDCDPSLNIWPAFLD